ncbi:MAG: hypothetical protein AABY44_05830 [Nitrospirota bacterium]
MTKKQLREYCEAEFENIDSVLSELAFVIKPKKQKYSIADLAATATFIHNCYNGIENVLKRILVYLNIDTKETPTWHKDLLKISFDRKIISERLYNALSNYLSFRHFFVHAYSFTLRWEELKPLVNSLESTLIEFKTAIDKYINNLD